MNQQQHTLAKKIFLVAVNLQGKELKAYLSSTTADMEVISLVNELLDAYTHNTQKTQDFIHDVALNIGRSPGIFPSDRYLLLKKIGQGGMGDVYLAQRKIKSIKQQVAIKILQFDDHREKDRFRQEMKILSQLSHPNVSQFIDADFLIDGRPYVVMEYVEGKTITDYCSSAELTIGEIVSLFRILCEAILHAHRNLIIHRDIKPENILVNTSGILKLLDFGIAKVIEESDKNSKTLINAMTPAYASPEQFLGKAISVSSDIYSLGVLLYELLTGVRPFNRDEFTPVEYEKLLRNTHPQKPSERLAEVQKNSDLIHEVKSVRRRMKLITGDLDAIVLKALEFDTSDRYQTVNEFVEDLERYQEHRPVLAKNRNWFDVVNKFVTRNNALVLVIMAFVIFIFFTFKQKLDLNELSIELSEKSKAVSINRSVAAREKARAEYMVNSLSHSYYADPFNNGKKDLIIAGSVNVATGNLFFEEIISAESESIKFSIFYNSNYANQTRDFIWGFKNRDYSHKNLGTGWDHNFAKSINGDRQRIDKRFGAYRGDGGFITFVKNNNEWINESTSHEKFDQIIKDSKSTRREKKYVITNDQKEKEYYDDFEYLLRIEGLERTIYVRRTFHLTSEVIKRIESDDDSWIELTYAPDSIQIKQISDKNSTWVLQYDDRNNLSQIVYPNGSKKTFSYKGNLLDSITVVDDSGERSTMVRYRYDPFNRIYSILFNYKACGKQDLLISYNNDKTRTVTNQSGQINRYSVERINGVWSVVNSEIEFEYSQENCKVVF